MSEQVIIPKPGKIYNDFICQGSDGNYYVKDINGNWVKVAGGSSERYIPIDCSTNPFCPIAKAGDKLLVTASGKFGGRSGIKVDKGDLILCYADNNEERPWGGGGPGGLDDASFLPVEHNIDMKDVMEYTKINQLTSNNLVIKNESGNKASLEVSSIYIGDYRSQIYEISGQLRTEKSFFLDNELNNAMLSSNILRATYFISYKAKKNQEALATGSQMDSHYSFININSSEENSILELYPLGVVERGHVIMTIIKNNTANDVILKGSFDDTINRLNTYTLQARKMVVLFGFANGVLPGEWIC